MEFPKARLNAAEWIQLLEKSTPGHLYYNSKSDSYCAAITLSKEHVQLSTAKILQLSKQLSSMIFHLRKKDLIKRQTSCLERL